MIVTPDELIRTPRRRRPSGIVWDDLDEDRIEAIPALRALRS